MKTQRLCWLALLLVTITLPIACTAMPTPAPLLSITATLTSLRPTATLPSTATALPTSSATPTPLPTFTPTPRPTLTPVPYTDAPFGIVFIRDGNLWMAEIGPGTERQLTDEAQGWAVIEFAVSPDGARVAYIPREDTTLDAMIKLLDLKSGEIRAVAGEGDAFSEYSVQWLDKNHIAFPQSEFCVRGHEGCREGADWRNLFSTKTIINVDNGSTTQVSKATCIYWSPNGQFELTCYGDAHGDGPRSYTLRDRYTGESWQVIGEKEYAWFVGWWPDNKNMVFNIDNPDTITTEYDVYLINTSTKQRRLMRPYAELGVSGEYSPDWRTIAYGSLWLSNLDGTDPRQIASSDNLPSQQIQELHFSPDGKRLIFRDFDRQSRIWTIRIDGTDLRLVVSNGHLYQVLPSLP